MSRKALKKILGDVGSGKDIIPLFLEARRSPSQVYCALKSFLESPDKTLVRKVAAKYKVSPQYLYDRISDIVEKVDRFRETNPYAVLNLTFHADAKAIQNNWKALQKKWHPDRQGGGNDSLLMTQKINDAYQILKTPESRKAYDKQYAPFLAIAKDIEDHSSHSFQRRERRLALKVFLIGGVLFIVTLSYLWSLRSHHPAQPVKTTTNYMNKKTREIDQVTQVRKEPEAREIVETYVAKGKTSVPSVSELRDVSREAPRAKHEMKAAKKTAEKKPLIVKESFDGACLTDKARETSKEKHVRKRVTCLAADIQGGKILSYHTSVDYVFSTPLGGSRGKGFPHVGGHANFRGRVTLVQAEKKQKKQVNGKVAFRQVEKETEGPFGEPGKVVKKYFECYCRGDDKGLFSLFDENAVENGIPVREAINNYKAFFRCLKVVRFDFREKKRETRGGKYFMDGSYVMEYKKASGEKKFKNEGKVSFVVVRDKGNKWLIKNVEYHSN